MIEVANLSKRYGDLTAVQDVSFTAVPGEILGFLGPNGAGKTTTLRVITGFLPATSGTVRVSGFDVFEQSAEVRRRIGYLPENPPLYSDMTVVPYLRFAGKIHGLGRSEVGAAVDRAIDTCGLGNVANRLLGHLSKGYRQRVGLAQALIHEPEVLILDEPTNGLDPGQIRDMLAFIRSLGAKRTIVLSTHILSQVLSACHKVVIINEGRVVVEAPLGDLTRDRSLEDVYTQAISGGGVSLADDGARV
jgi:ABC-2 type transport system ATP-binding protein